MIKNIRVGVLFGGRSGEHEVSLASARNVMVALQEAGYVVAPIGITTEGRWLTNGDPMVLLAEHVAIAEENGSRETTTSDETKDPAISENQWTLLPQIAECDSLSTVDVIFPVLHGPYGEDGTVQGMLEMANIPYVGCGVLSSALAMDKAVSKKLFAAQGLRQVPYRVFTRAAWREQAQDLIDGLTGDLTYPLFIKPANLGSSVGVSKAIDRSGLKDAIDLACAYDRKIIVEQAVNCAREIEVSVLGNSHSLVDAPIVSVPGEILPGHDFYDYDAKYQEGISDLQIPASLTSAQSDAIREMGLRAFDAVDGSGLARVDFLLDDESGDIFLNEINTMPGFTRSSMYPKLWEASGIPYPELVDRLIQLALSNHEDRQQNRIER